MECFVDYDVYDWTTFFAAISALLIIFWHCMCFFFKLNLARDLWIDNIMIDDFSSLDDLENQKGIHPKVYRVHDTSEFTAVILFLPKDVIIEKVVLRKIKEYKNGKTYDKCKYRTEKVFENVSPHSPLCIVIERREVIPDYILTWYSDYGSIATYEFLENRRNGDNSINGITYTFKFWAKIRKILNIK